MIDNLQGLLSIRWQNLSKGYIKNSYAFVFNREIEENKPNQ